MFWNAPLKYRGATSAVISSRSHPLRMGRFDRCGTGTGEKWRTNHLVHHHFSRIEKHRRYHRESA
jgi:hypothetical protein